MTTQQEACKIEWITIPAPDLEKAGNFYSTMFGWEITEYSPDFWLFKSGSISGGLGKKMKPRDDGIGFSITVEDIQEVLRRIVSVGGSVAEEKYDIGDGFGFCASFKDPNGNSIELWSEQ